MKNLIELKSKFRYLSFGLIWGFIFTFGMINSACTKSEKIDEISDSDEYYVTYQVSSSTIYYGGKLDVIISTESNNNLALIINEKQLWETIIGPVKKGFIAKLKVNAQGNTYNHLRLYTNIYVSKNGSPFALKKTDGSDTPRDAVQLNYTIDY